MDAPARNSPRVIALLNQKGGVGKTTSTVNLGAALAEAGQRVCLIDLDPQAHLTLHLGYDRSGPVDGQPDGQPDGQVDGEAGLPEGQPTIYDLFIEPDVPASAAIITARKNLDLVPSEVDLAAAEVELASHPDRQRILKRKLEEIRDRYDVILMDCPPSLGLLTLNALALAREVFVPMQAHFLALQGVGKLLETVGLVCRSVNPDLAVTGILLCMHEGQTTLAREVVADLEGYFDRCRSDDVPWSECRVLMPPIRRNIKLAEAPSFGQTIFDYSAWCPGAIDYRRLAQGLIARWQRHSEPVPPVAPAASVTPETPAPVAAPARPDTPATPDPVTVTIEDKPEPVETSQDDGPPMVIVSPFPAVRPAAGTSVGPGVVPGFGPRVEPNGVEPNGAD